MNVFTKNYSNYLNSIFMEKLKTLIIPILIAITLAVSLYSCVMVYELSDSIEDLQEEDQLIMEELKRDLNAPDEKPVLNDSVAFYISEKRVIETGYKEYVSFTLHRFFFPRAKYTDSLYNGFNIVIVDLNKKGILIEHQDNVTISKSNMGELIKNWKFNIDSLSFDKKPYSDYSETGLKIKTYIRTNKF